MSVPRAVINEWRAEDGEPPYVEDTLARCFHDFQPIFTNTAMADWDDQHRGFLAGSNPAAARVVFERRFGANPINQSNEE